MGACEPDEEGTMANAQDGMPSTTSRSPIRTVQDVMSDPAVTATASETIAAAAARMHERRVGSVVVVDGTRPVGILTERDLLRMTSSGNHPDAAKVGEWMTAAPDTITL